MLSVNITGCWCLLDTDWMRQVVQQCVWRVLRYVPFLGEPHVSGSSPCPWDTWTPWFDSSQGRVLGGELNNTYMKRLWFGSFKTKQLKKFDCLQVVSETRIAKKVRGKNYCFEKIPNFSTSIFPDPRIWPVYSVGNLQVRLKYVVLTALNGGPIT